MAGVNVPQRQPGPTGTLAPVVGGAIGGAFGGPVGAAIGSKIGAMAGTPKPGPGGVDDRAGQTDAIDRRLQSIQEDPNVQLAQAAAALKQAPPDVQDQYGPTILAAQQRAAMGGVA